MTSPIRIVLAGDGAPIELSRERQFRSAIASGLMSRETWVRVLQGDDSRGAVAGSIPELAALFDEILGPIGEDLAPEGGAEDASPAADAAEHSEMKDSSAGESAADSDEKPAPAADAGPVDDRIEGIGPVPEAPLLGQGVSQPDAERLGRRIIMAFGALGILAIVLATCESVSSNREAARDAVGDAPASYAAPDDPPARPELVAATFVARGVEVFDSPDRSSRVMGRVNRGDRLAGHMVQGTDERYLQIEGGAHAGGFVPAAALRSDPRPDLRVAPASLVAAQAAPLYAEPYFNAGRIGGIGRGETIEVIGATEFGWTEVAVGSGVGYLAPGSLVAEEVEAAEEAPPPEPERPPPTRPPRPQPQAEPPEPAIPQPPPPSRPPVVVEADWARRPSPEFPERAQSRGFESGEVTMSCVVERDGTPTNCSVISEDPAGAGFGQAALSSMRRARFSPRTVDGVAERGRARFTIRFQLSEE